MFQVGHVQKHLGKTYQNSTTIAAYMFFRDAKVQVQHEYVLFDFPAIVGSVGGSLGLFLGFSVLDAAMMLVHWLSETKCNNKSECFA